VTYGHRDNGYIMHSWLLKLRYPTQILFFVSLLLLFHIKSHAELPSNSSELLITTPDLGSWTAGIYYSRQLQATGGSGNLEWSDINGNLESTGLALSHSGLLSGTPLNSGNITFTAHLSDTTGAIDEKIMTLSVNPPVMITADQLPSWTIGRPYTFTLSASGGTPPLRWNDQNGTFYCGGLKFDSNGVISGTPTVVTTKHFMVQVIDSAGDFDTGPLSITINPSVLILTDTLPTGKEGLPYSFQLDATGGTGNIVFIDRNNELLGTGLTISSEGILSGNPIRSEIIYFVARATDIAGSYDESIYALNIRPDFICGDANSDTKINLLDVGFIISFLYRGGAMPYPIEAGDVNDSGNLNLLDVSFLIKYLYRSGPPLQCE
jgi:hypothetical protein